MAKRGLNLDIPGWGALRLNQALFDLNGTLALDGIISDPVRERLQLLQERFEVYLITADTHGTVADLVRGWGDLEIVRIQSGKEDRQKLEWLERLGPSQTAAFGNGANDALMLRSAALGICVMQGEGAALPTLLASNILVRSAEDALDLLLQPARLMATLRS
jgi:soluble P-type ATPase